mgnify:CR=1 FL=1
MYSESEENYLKAIFTIAGKDGRRASTNDVADLLKTKASSVTDMLQKLSDKGLIKYQKYKGVSLTAKGEKIATGVVRKHRLWEVFLLEKLNFKWDEIHDIAEQLEHVNSARLTDKLDEFLGFPTHDPHGDPIPDKDGKIRYHKGILLSDLEPGDVCEIVGVKEHSPDFLQYLEGVKLLPGMMIKVLTRYHYDSSIILQINKNELMVSERVSKNIFVNPVQN